MRQELDGFVRNGIDNKVNICDEFKLQCVYVYLYLVYYNVGCYIWGDVQI